MTMKKTVDPPRPAVVGCTRQARKGKAVGVEANDNTNSCRKSTTGARKGCLLPSCRLVSFGVEAVKKTTQAEARKAKAPAGAKSPAPAARKAAPRPAHSCAAETSTRKAEAKAIRPDFDAYRPVKCSLCGVEVPWIESHNPWPLDGGDDEARCCFTCNAVKVIPARIRFARKQERKAKKGGAL